MDPVVTERAKQFYIDRDIKGDNKKQEFLPLVHDFEVYLRDHEMFDNSAGAVELDEYDQPCGLGVGYRGTFQIDPKFNLQDQENVEPVKGYATSLGTQTYARRSNIVDPSNFKKVKMFDDHNDANELTLSKLMIGTKMGSSQHQQDFFSYMVLRQALLSGGVNHIDTGHSFRDHRAEYTVAKVLRTLFNKFGLSREEVFINSKQGFIGNNSFVDAPQELVLEELKQQTSLTEDDFCILDNGKAYYSLDAAFLEFSLNFSLQKLGLETLDCVLLDDPFETTYWHEFTHASTERREDRYYTKIAKAFEFYERAVQDGKIRSYGLTGTESLLQDPVKFKRRME